MSELVKLDGFISTLVQKLHQFDDRLNQLEVSLPELKSQLDSRGTSTRTTTAPDDATLLRMQHLEDEIKDIKSRMQGNSMSAPVFGAAQQDTEEAINKACADTLAAAATNDPSKSKDGDIDSHQDYVFEESVYDAVFFVFMTHMKTYTSLMIIIGFVTNLAMQIGMIVVLRMNKFSAEPLAGDALDRLDMWRKSEGHSYRNADALTGVSLASRVCALDDALSTAASQVQIFGDSDDFLSSLFDMEGVHLGPFLCNIALIIWTFTCALELRKSFEFMEAVISLPRVHGRSQIVSDNEEICVLGLHPRRVLIGLGVVACRAAIALFLLYHGSFWLAYTTSVQDLLLNASALGFVLDIDEVVFSVLAPTHMLGLIDSLRSISLPWSRSYSFALPFVMVILIITSVLAINVVALDDTYSRLNRASDILCSESTKLDFVVGVNELGWVYTAPTVPYGEDADTAQLVASRMEVIGMLQDRKPEADVYVNRLYDDDEVDAGNAARVEEYTTDPTEVIARTNLCEDETGPSIGGKLWTATGNVSFKSVDTCQQLKPYCYYSGKMATAHIDIISRNARLMCPITCGCADPLSGLWHLAQHDSGCPFDSCRWPMYYALAETDTTSFTYDCQDRSLPELQEGTGWSEMLEMWSMMELLSNSTIQVLQSKGCEGIQDLSYDERRTMCTRQNIWESGLRYPFFGAGVMCPESCGCYYAYGGEDPQDPYPYTPGDPALCPMSSCYARYAASYYAQQAAYYGDGGDGGDGGYGDGGYGDGGDGGGGYGDGGDGDGDQ